MTRELLGYQYAVTNPNGEHYCLCIQCHTELKYSDDTLGSADFLMQLLTNAVIRILADDDLRCNFQRCVRCNSPLVTIVNGTVQQALPYVNEDAFLTGEGVCFISSEHYDEITDRHTRDSLYDLIQKSPFGFSTQRLDILFSCAIASHWLHPATLLSDEERDHCMWGAPGDNHYISPWLGQEWEKERAYWEKVRVEEEENVG